MAIRYNEIGLCHKAKGNVDKALEFFSKAVKIFQDKNDRDNIERVRANMDRIHQLKEKTKRAAGNIKRTGITRDHEFRWDELLDRIVRGNVIPVIGHGLYRVEIESKGKSGVLLYDYLAEQVSEECGSTLQPDANHKFAKACLSFFKKKNNDYLELANFLKEALKGIRLVPDSSLWKLARIKTFNIFITTAYDDFLVNTIKTVRDISTRVHYYSLAEKNLDKLDSDLPDCVLDSKCTLVYHVFGNMGKTIAPAYTERDIMENLLEFRIDAVKQPENRLFQVLKERSLLLMGGGFDDWLYRLFIRILSNEPYEFFMKRTTRYVADDFRNYKRDPFQELTRFLRDYDSEVFYTGSGSDFVDLLFEKLADRYPEEIIPPSAFPGTVFISFEGRDRAAAKRLVGHLREDGFNVWLNELTPSNGEALDENNLRAIDKSSVFIPLISQNSRRILTKDEKLKYHIREWQWAYSKMIHRNDLTILPVKIDDTESTYDAIKNFTHFNIPGGGRLGNYEKLKKRLLEIQGLKR